MEKLDGDWEKETVLGSSARESYNNYFYKKEPAYRVIVDIPRANSLAGYFLIEKDLRSSLIWLNEIKSILSDDENFNNPNGHVNANYDREKFNYVKALFVAALTFYGKCFTQCKGRKIKLEKCCLDSKFHTTHGDAMKYRHNFAAHSGEELLEQACVVLALDKKKQPNTYEATLCQGVKFFTDSMC